MPKRYKALHDLDAPYLLPLMRLVETQSKATLANWCLDYAEAHLLPLWQKHVPGDPRPESVIAAARAWLSGAIKLPQAKPVILQCHAAAREAEAIPSAQAAARAIGQSASVIHSARHCMGMPLYGALALAYDRLGTDLPWNQIEAYAAEECSRMEAALRAVAVENEPHPAKIVWKR
jgi:hypothetical protein